MKRSDLLLPFSALYGAIVSARAALYEKGVFKARHLGAPTVSVGNITVGGTGKTPLVAFAARVLAGKGEKVCILTRGYKRENEAERVLVSDVKRILVNAREAGDEPFELASRLLGTAMVVADADRAAAGKWARENLGASAFVLDDAFQHRKVRRDLDIVCIDATNPFGNKKLLPAGILREPVTHLARAGAIVITRANLIDQKKLADLKAEISKHNQTAEVFVSENKIAGLIDLKEFHAKPQSSQSLEKNSFNTHHSPLTGYLAFCGLGNPEAFFEQLRRERFDLVSTRAFPDHYLYSRRDVLELEKAAAETGAQILLTTAKDAVKLQDAKFNLPCFVVESRMTFDDEENLRALIAGAGPAPAG